MKTAASLWKPQPDPPRPWLLLLAGWAVSSGLALVGFIFAAAGAAHASQAPNFVERLVTYSLVAYGAYVVMTALLFSVRADKAAVVVAWMPAGAVLLLPLVPVFIVLAS